MHYYLIGTKTRARTQDNFFTYHSETKFSVGQIVEVQLGKKTTVGVIFKVLSIKPKFKTKPIIGSVTDNPLPQELLKTLIWLSQYYLSDISDVIQTALPTGITKNRRPLKNGQEPIKIKPLKPTSEQTEAINKISSSPKQTFLLHGVTGSGKTTVYLELAKKTLAANKSVVLIVPEISLTAQLIAQVKTYFKQPILVHSRLSESQRHQNWLQILNSKQPRIIVGTRSALFSPLKNIGLIIIDEAHETSLKQDKNPKYNALRLTSKLGQAHQAKVIFGSATPLVADYWLAEQKNSSIIELKKPALTIKKPTIELINMTKKLNFSRHSFLSNQLLQAIKKSLANNEQILLFHNRRGSAKVTMCEACGWLAECPTCQIPLSLHADKFNLICHACGQPQAVPKSCPNCHSAELIHKGIGTKLIEHEIKKIFKNASVFRFDTDSKKDQTLDQKYDDIVSGKIDILIGTQILAKGLNLPKLSTVGIIQAENGLFLPDYSSNERTFELLSQVIGRVGRNLLDTQVIVQTYQPDHPIIKLGLNQDYAKFYQFELANRQKLKYPPFYFLLKLKIAYKNEASCIKHSRLLAQQIKAKHPKAIVIGPMPSFYEKAGGKINWQLIVKSTNRKTLEQIVQELPNSKWQYDIDPSNLL